MPDARVSNPRAGRGSRYPPPAWCLGRHSLGAPFRSVAPAAARTSSIARCAEPKGLQPDGLAGKEIGCHPAQRLIGLLENRTMQRIARCGLAPPGGIFVFVQGIANPPAFALRDPTVGRIDQLFHRFLEEGIGADDDAHHSGLLDLGKGGSISGGAVGAAFAHAPRPDHGTAAPGRPSGGFGGSHRGTRVGEEAYLAFRNAQGGKVSNTVRIFREGFEAHAAAKISLAVAREYTWRAAD